MIMAIIRDIRQEEIPVLEDFLYEAIFIPEGVPAPPRSIIENDDLQVYVRDFGKLPDDRCLIAEVEGKIVGAAWTRIMDDYGHIDNQTPSLAISLYKEYRGMGIGTDAAPVAGAASRRRLPVRFTVRPESQLCLEDVPESRVRGDFRQGRRSSDALSIGE